MNKKTSSKIWSAILQMFMAASSGFLFSLSGEEPRQIATTVDSSFMLSASTTTLLASLNSVQFMIPCW